MKMRIFVLSILLLMSHCGISQMPSSGKLKIYKLQSNFIEGMPSSTGPGTGEGVAIVDSNGLFVRKVTVSALGLPSGTAYRLAKFTAPTTLGNTASLVDSSEFYGFGQIEGSGLQNARFNFTTQNSSSSGNGIILKNSSGNTLGVIKNTGSFSFGITSALDWDEVNTKLTSNSPFQFGTSTNHPLYFLTNGSIRTALDATGFTVNVPVDNTADSYSGLARGTTAQRPTATFSRIRANSDSSGIEYADGSAWQLIASRNWVRDNFGGSATTIYNGDGSISSNRTVTLGANNLTFNASSTGDIAFTLGSDATGDTYYRSAGGVFTRLAAGADGDVLTVSSGLPSWQASSLTTLYNGNGTLSGNRNLSGDNKQLNLGIPASKLSGFAITTSGQIFLQGQVQFSSALAADANYSINLENTWIVLPEITANRTVSLTGPSTGSGKMLIIWNKNSSGNSWSFTGGSVIDAAGSAITNLTNDTVYYLMNDGTDWVKIN